MTVWDGECQKQKNLTPTQHKLNPRMCTVRQSLTRLKIPQSHKSKIKAGGSTQDAKGNLSFKFQQIPKKNGTIPRSSNF